MHMTMFSDASVDGKTGAAGWGSWIKRDGWPSGLIFGAPFKNKLHKAGVAELCAIANTLHTIRGETVAGISKIMVQSDSVEALAYIRAHVNNVSMAQHKDSAHVPYLVTPRKELDPLILQALGVIEDFMRDECIDLQLRHVKGHTKGAGRSWVNAQCDREAKKHMRIKRAHLEKEAKHEQGSGSQAGHP